MKLKRYNSFLESNLILESLLHFSEDFRDLLAKVSSPIGKYLIEIERVDDKPFVTNYIDLSDDRESLLAVLDKKAQAKISKDGFTEMDMFSTDKMGNLRQKIRAGKVIRQILSLVGGNFTETQINEFIDQFRQAWDEKYTFKEEEKEEDIFKNFRLVEGEEITKWYHLDNYDLVDGTLGKSCMRYSKCQYYFDIYTENPDKCKLLILLNDEGTKIRGRALIWELDRPEVTYMDRQYTIDDDKEVTLFRMYAKKQGWHYRVDNTTGVTTDVVNPEGKLVEYSVLYVELENWEFDYYPYVDTLQYLIPEDGILTTKRGRDYWQLSDTDGGGRPCEYCSGSGSVECPECEGSEVNTCDECSGDGQVDCSYCDGDGKTECDECSGEGEIECGECDGSGAIECSTCEGSGEDEDGNECGDCSGDGKIDCDECSANGKIDCEDCGGTGNFECSSCDGDGARSCDECGGQGEVTCYNCTAGVVDCPECG